MKVLIVYASRYGSTKTIAEWTAQRLALAGMCVDITTPSESIDFSDYSFIIFGSGIYAHKFLPEIETLIKSNQSELQQKKTGIFGVAMRTETFFKGGHAYGGAVMLERYGVMLGSNCRIGKILGGEMIFEKLTEKDKEGLERFYESIRLSDTEKTIRRTPRTLLNKRECWDFAEEILSLIQT